MARNYLVKNLDECFYEYLKRQGMCTPILDCIERRLYLCHINFSLRGAYLQGLVDNGPLYNDLISWDNACTKILRHFYDDYPTIKNIRKIIHHCKYVSESANNLDTLWIYVDERTGQLISRWRDNDLGTVNWRADNMLPINHILKDNFDGIVNSLNLKKAAILAISKYRGEMNG